jgi:hypothetical protein
LTKWTRSAVGSMSGPGTDRPRAVHGVACVIGENIRLSLTRFTTTPNYASHVVLRRRHKGWFYEQDRNRYCIALGHRRKDRQGSSRPVKDCKIFLPSQLAQRAIAKSSAFPGARSSWSTTRETVRVTPSRHATLTSFSPRASPRGFGIDTQLSSRLSPEAIHVGEGCP